MVTKNEGIAALIINLFFPGVGTVIWGDRTHGIWQIVMWVASVPLMLVLIGFLLYPAAWIWALISSINILQSAK